MFQGLRIVAQVLIPGIIGPAIGAMVLKNAEMVVNDDGTSSSVPIGYQLERERTASEDRPQGYSPDIGIFGYNVNSKSSGALFQRPFFVLR